MDALIVFESIHHGNTEKVAKAMAKALGAKLARPVEVTVDAISRSELVGFGSGVFFSRHHKALFDLLDRLPAQNGRKAFIFTTSGWPRIPVLNEFDRPLEKRLVEKGFRVVDRFDCRGFDTYGAFKLIGGIRRNRPDSRDLERAGEFARKLIGI